MRSIASGDTRRAPLLSHNERMDKERAIGVIVLVAIVGASDSLAGQWFKYPSPRAPRTASGEVDLAAVTPRLTNGKPDLSGVWMTAEPACVVRGVLPLAELVKLLP